ncbi:MAG: hypothetical protein ACLUSP_09400 [Christensenellales bacterium]
MRARQNDAFLVPIPPLCRRYVTEKRTICRRYVTEKRTICAVPIPTQRIIGAGMTVL